MNTPKVSKSHGSFLQFNQILFTFPSKTKQTNTKVWLFQGASASLLLASALVWQKKKEAKKSKGWLQPSKGFVRFSR